MKKIGSIGLCVIVGFFFLLPSALFSQSSSWNDYDGELFSIRYPSAWSIIGGEMAMAFLQMDEEEGETFDGAVITAQEFDPEKTSPEELYKTGFITIMMGTLDEDERGKDNYHEELFGDLEPGLTDTYKGEIEIAGLPGYTLTGTLAAPPLYIYTAITVVEDEYGFVVMGLFPQEQKDEMTAMIEEMIESVSFSR